MALPVGFREADTSVATKRVAIEGAAVERVVVERPFANNTFKRMPVDLLKLVLDHVDCRDYLSIIGTNRSAPSIAYSTLKHCWATTYRQLFFVACQAELEGVVIDGIPINIIRKMPLDVPKILQCIGNHKTKFNLSTFPYSDMTELLQTEIGCKCFIQNIDSLDVPFAKVLQFVRVAREDQRATVAAHVCMSYLRDCDGESAGGAKNILRDYNHFNVTNPELLFQVFETYIRTTGVAFKHLHTIVAESAAGDSFAIFSPILRNVNQMIKLASTAMDASRCWTRHDDDERPTEDVVFSIDMIDQRTGSIEVQESADSLASDDLYGEETRWAADILNGLLHSPACQEPRYEALFLGSLKDALAGGTAISAKNFMDLHKNAAIHWHYLQSMLTAAALTRLTSLPAAAR